MLILFLTKKENIMTNENVDFKVDEKSSNVLPFIFARLTDEYKNNDKGVIFARLTDVKDWIVVIAKPDFKIYDSRWMCCHEQGNFCFIPDVDISIEKDHIFHDFNSARNFVKNWWKNN